MIRWWTIESPREDFYNRETLLFILLVQLVIYEIVSLTKKNSSLAVFTPHLASRPRTLEIYPTTTATATTTSSINSQLPPTLVAEPQINLSTFNLSLP